MRRATRALHFGGSSIEAAINWIDQHGDDPEVNEPLLVKPEGRAVGGSMPCSHACKLTQETDLCVPVLCKAAMQLYARAHLECLVQHPPAVDMRSNGGSMEAKYRDRSLHSQSIAHTGLAPAIKGLG